ncbi:hypothetical protein HOLleu_03640 [Holothuria leucospilota]|uniref:Interferon-induced transmembrane protein n=1 Tax=Holothuria leucospilota TaxID=206669 RepID=A0A9Q1CT95_HOLLE|nr:hypothetical protein HOLleu_03640 [Holothuria leucospilota]
MEKQDEHIPGQALSPQKEAPPPSYTAAPNQPPQTTLIIREASQPMPSDYMIFACVVIWLCPGSLICGLVAFFCSMKVKSAYNAGDYDGALAASKQAKLWSIIGVVLGIVDVITGIVVTILMIVLAAAAAATAAASFGDVLGDLNDLNDLNNDLNDNYQLSNWWWT